MLSKICHPELLKGLCYENISVYSEPKFCHIMPILGDLHWLPVRQCIDFKIINNMAHFYLSSLICVVTPSYYSLRSVFDGTLLGFPPMKSSKIVEDCSFMFAAPKLWNNLPWDIGQARVCNV